MIYPTGTCLNIQSKARSFRFIQSFASFFLNVPFPTATHASFPAGAPEAGAEGITDADTEPILEEASDSKDIFQKLGFPEVEGDTSPSAIVPAACKHIQKVAAKLDGLLESLTGDSLTPLQTRHTSYIADCDCFRSQVQG